MILIAIKPGKAKKPYCECISSSLMLSIIEPNSTIWTLN